MKRENTENAMNKVNGTRTVKDTKTANTTEKRTMKSSANTRVFKMPFARVYPLYVEKAERKGRTRTEVDQIILWLTGYSQQQLMAQIEAGHDFETFFQQAPHIHDHAVMITGRICGVKIEEIEDPLMRKIRYLDKLIDELAMGKRMEKILR